MNPDHLEPVTHVENIRRGARTLLTEDQVREIRSSDETPAALALRFGVDRSTIYAVRQRKSWKDVA